MALAQKLLADEFNRAGHAPIDHRTYVFLGDGCLMEGISHEACSLAGTWRLNKLVVFYDDNGISIDGEVKGWGSATTRRAGSMPMAGRCCAMWTGMTRPRSTRRCRPHMRRTSQCWRAARRASATARPTVPAPRKHTAKRWTTPR